VGLIFPAFVFGHGVEVYDVTAEGKPVHTVYFRYSTGEPMSFAKLKIYPPSTMSKNIESLISITDRNGLFSFVPDENGTWRIDIEDGMGHAGSINVVSNDGEKSTANIAHNRKLPPAITAVLGISLLLNIFTIWYFMLKKKKAAHNAH
jgi:nickel transport protein